MAAPAPNPYRDPCYDTFYEVYYQELISSALVRSWQTVDLIMKGLVAATSSGSAIAGLSFWNQPFWQPIWASIAAIAAIASVVYSVMEVASRVKNQEGCLRTFAGLRVDLETLLRNLIVGMNIDDARNAYNDLRGRYRDALNLAPTDILETEKLRNAVQDYLELVLKTRGYTE